MTDLQFYYSNKDNVILVTAGGNTRALVVALDVGTTFSGVSYAILEPGEVPKIHGVTRYGSYMFPEIGRILVLNSYCLRFPGQEHVAGNSKIPSVMYYDRRGKMQAAGAEAESASVLSQGEDEGWVKAELYVFFPSPKPWIMIYNFLLSFKLRLRPKTMKLQMNGMQLGPLPRNKTSVDVFGDFLAYLFRCVCSNGMVRRECVSGDIIPRTRRLPAKYAAATDLQTAQIRRLVRLSWDGLQARLRALKDTTEQPANAEELLRRWLQRGGLSVKQLMPTLLAAWRDEGSENTRYGVVNALTRVATHNRDLNERERRALASLAGLLAFKKLHLCDRCWSVLAGRGRIQRTGGE